MLRSGSSVAYPSRAQWWRSLKFQKDILAFACDEQPVFYHSCREIYSLSAVGAFLGRNSSHKSMVFSAGRPSLQGHHKPGTAEFPTETGTLTTDMLCGICLLSLFLWKHFAKIICKSSFPLHGLIYLFLRGRLLILFYNF